MSMWRGFGFFIMCAAAAIMPSSLKAQSAQGVLSRAKAIQCSFTVMVVGTWGNEKPEVQVRPVALNLQFEGINADEGTAELKSDYGKYDIIVRYATGYLHLVQSYLDGRLYTTTIMEKKTAAGRFKAVHSRHEL